MKIYPFSAFLIFALLTSCATRVDSCFSPGSSKCLAVSDAYIGSDGTVGNTLFTTDASTGLLANDRSGVTCISGTLTTTLGGSVTVSSDGSFTYTPPIGATGTDSFTYEVIDSSGRRETNTVAVGISGVVWYVDNTAASGGDGSSHAPFQTLASAESASSAGDTIYIYEGNGTSTNQNSGITLKDNQKLIGQGVGLVALGKTLIAATSKPTIGNTAGAGISLASGNEIRGLIVDGTTSHAIFSSSSITDLLVDQIEITGTNTTTEAGIRVDDFSGDFEVYQSTFTTTNDDIGNAIELTTLNDNPLNAVIAQNTINGSPGAGDILNGITVTVGTGSGTGTQNVRIIENTINTIQGGATQTGIDIDANGDTSADFLIDGNTLTSTGSHGIQLEPYNNSTPRIDMTNNTVTNSGSRAITITARNSSVASTQILSNTITTPSGNAVRANASNSANITTDIDSNTISSNVGTAIFTSNGGSGTNSNFHVRNNTVSGSPAHGFEVTYTTTGGGGSTCARFTGNDTSSLTPSTADFRSNKEGGSTQSLEDTVGGSANANAYIPAANTGFTSFYHVNSQPTLVASGTCNLLTNLRPTITDIANQAVSASSSLNGILFTVTDNEDSNDSLTVSVDTSDQSIVPNTNITINHLGGNSRSLDITPESNITGEVLIIVTVTDSSGLVSVEVFKLTIS